jgi:hypothetical protein
MRASSRTTEPVYEERRPSFSSFRPGTTPGSARSTRNALIPASVRAKTTVNSAMPPLVT